MESFVCPFKNDMFPLVAQAFKNLYPDKEYSAYWEPEMPAEGPEGKKPFGITDFGDDGSVTVLVDPNIPIIDAVEIFAHELAHVAAGIDHGHDEVWEEAFEAIYAEYNRIAEAFYEEE